MLEKSNQSYQLIGPYLREFLDLNRGSTTAMERDVKNHMQRLFVCPGFIDTSMRYVRPVLSLDAAHLRSQWKGTLYVATVKSACDEIYPVAFAIMRDNENAAGWKWF